MTDFVVIGGGVAGVSAAAHLAPHGSVILLEKESSLAYHTSGRSAAMLVEDYGSDGARPLVKAARPFLEKPPEGAVDSPLLSDRAVMWVSGRRTSSSLEKQAAEAQERGARCQLLTPAEAMEHVPALRAGWLGGALYEPSGADIDVAGLHQAFVRIARSHGAEIRTNAPVTEIEREGGAWSVRSGEYVVRAEAVVNAAGAWGDRIATMAGVDAIGLQPMRRTAFMVPGSHESASWPMVVEASERFYFRPDGVQFLCSLAEEVPSEPTDARARMEDVALAIERINEATTFAIRTVNSQWTGLRTFAPDRDLVIGEDPEAPGFYWLVGQGGIGIQTSPGYGKLLACLATGESLPDHYTASRVDPERTSPARFR
ncbi:MAG TPA: FAD-dependent oxidoreductase [Acidimicrobiia bacterium]|nr:FAD-dependent oxidoreductase [Acidimicrobiia bacterium]